MDLPTIFIIGASGHGMVTLEAARAQGYTVAGFLDSFKPEGTTLLGASVLGKPADLPALMQKHGVGAGILAVSNNFIRSQVAGQLAEIAPSFVFVTVVHPTAWISPTATLGHGTLVLAGAVVNAACVVGDHAIINTKTSLDHESEVEAFASLLPGVTTGGAVKIGTGSCVCAGSTLVHQVRIGRHTMVGAGSLVLRDLPDNSLCYGSPARVVRTRLPEERHF
jgi:sugar O-acyltransferase (sialic acid O-acetyltransferase NeuD family)